MFSGGTTCKVEMRKAFFRWISVFGRLRAVATKSAFAGTGGRCTKWVLSPRKKGARIGEEIVAAEEKKGFRVGGLNRFLLRTRYFTDSGILGTKEFVSRHYRLFEEHFTCRREKRPRAVAGLDGLYSLKRLAEGAP